MNFFPHLIVLVLDMGMNLHPPLDFRSILKNAPKPWEQCGWAHSSASQYLSSFYFIIYTIMTVGYGDQSADASSKKVIDVEGK